MRWCGWWGKEASGIEEGEEDGVELEGGGVGGVGGVAVVEVRGGEQGGWEGVFDVEGCDGVGSVYCQQPLCVIELRCGAVLRCQGLLARAVIRRVLAIGRHVMNTTDGCHDTHPVYPGRFDASSGIPRHQQYSTYVTAADESKYRHVERGRKYLSSAGSMSNTTSNH